MLEELENLDGPPPDKADIERRSQTQGGGDLIQDMLNEQAAEQPVPVEDEPEEMPNPDLDFSSSIPDMPDDIIPSSASDEGIDDELGGFVSQFSADDGQSATPADEDIFGGMDTTPIKQDLPDEMDDLKSLLGEESGDFAQTESVGAEDDLMMEPGDLEQPEQSGGFGDFEMPSFEPEQELKETGGDDFGGFSGMETPDTTGDLDIGEPGGDFGDMSFDTGEEKNRTVNGFRRLRIGCCRDRHDSSGFRYAG